MTHYCKAKSESKRYEIQHCHGDCLEKLGIPATSGHVLIDKIIDPEVGDIVWCSGVHAGSVSGYLKQIKEINSDGNVTVGTAYLDEAKDYTFIPEEILGTVIMAFEDIFGKTVYERKLNPIRTKFIPTND